MLVLLSRIDIVFMLVELIGVGMVSRLCVRSLMNFGVCDWFIVMCGGLFVGGSCGN